MKIRVKNKHLVLVAVFAFLALGLVYVAGGDYLFFRAESARRQGDNVKALAYYDALIERYPEHLRISEALYWSADILPGFDVFSATFFPSRSAVTRRDGGIPEFEQVTLTKEERYLRILQDYPNSGFVDNVIYRLAEIYQNKADARSEELYLTTLHNLASSNRIYAALRLIGMYLAQNRLDEALDTITYCQTHLPNHLATDVQMRLGDVRTAIGDYVAARAAYESVVPIVEEQVAKSPSLGMAESTLLHYKELVAEKLAELAIRESEGSKEQVPVAGRVTIHGRPLAGVQVYANQVIGQTRHYLNNENFAHWVTASDGSFGGELLQGVYEFGIRLDYEQAKLVEGTHLQIKNGELELSAAAGEVPVVEFLFTEALTLLKPSQDLVYRGEPIDVEWNEYPGAREYGISVSGIVVEDNGFSSTGGKNYKTEETRFAFASDTVSPFGVYGYDQEGILPTYLLDHPSVYDRLRITVQALDEDGAILSSSSGLVFSDGTIPGEILVQKREATQVQKLLNDRSYGEAVKLLEKQVENDPKDLESLWILARIYFYGTHNEWHDLTNADFVARDPEKSLQILRRIQEIEPSSEVEEAQDVVLHWLSRGS